MDQDAYRKTLNEINDRPCLFEKSVYSGMCRCSQAERFCLAEREGIHCKSDSANRQCSDLIMTWRKESRFALKSNKQGDPLSHADSLRIQIGGLRGLFELTHSHQPLPQEIGDIHGLITQALETYRKISEIPLQPIIQQIAAYKRRRSFKK